MKNTLPRDGWSDHLTYIKLHPPEPFSFTQALAYLARSPKECMYHIEGTRIVKLIPVTFHGSTEHVLIEVSSETDADLIIRFMGTALDVTLEVRLAAAAYVWDWFDLSMDLAPFYELAQQDPLLKNVVSDFNGLRLMGIADLFEAMSWGIIGQQINLAFAYTLKSRLVEAFGESVEWNGCKYWIFPKPEVIAELSTSDLTQLQFTGRKAEYLIGIAKLMYEHRLTKEELLALGNGPAMEKALVQLRGIGPWTANYVLMRCLRVPTAFPIEDVGLHNAVKHLLKLDAKPTLAYLRELSAPWGDYKSYATFYLWRVLY